MRFTAWMNGTGCLKYLAAGDPPCPSKLKICTQLQIFIATHVELVYALIILSQIVLMN